MFYEPGKGHGLPHDPFKAIVAPRPIGWIATVSPEGKPNLAPYSFFNAVCGNPPMVMFSSEGRKDTVTNCEMTGEFTCSHVDESLALAMNATAIDSPFGIDEFGLAALAAAPSRLVKPPHVQGASAVLECVVTEIMSPKTRSGGPAGSIMVIGEVVGVHLDERFLKDGLFDLAHVRPVARLGYMDYTTVSQVWPMRRPRWKDRAG